MAFKFRFENILKYRENIEKQKSIDFLNAERSYLKQKEKVASLVKERDEIFSFMKEISSSSEFDLVTFNIMREFVQKLEEDIKMETDIMFQLKDIMEYKRKELIKASQERKIMEKLREKDYNSYIEELNKKEVIELDEITSKKYNKGLSVR